MKTSILGGIMKRKFICLFASCLVLSSCARVDEVSQKVMLDIDSIGAVELSDEELIAKIESVYATLTESKKNK